MLKRPPCIHDARQFQIIPSSFSALDELFYWSTTGSKEIDVVWVKGKRRIGVEIKTSRTWRSGYAKTLNEFIDAGVLEGGYVVYRGKERYKSGQGPKS